MSLPRPVEVATGPEPFLVMRDLVKRYGLEPTVLIGDDVRAHEPLLSDSVEGGRSLGQCLQRSALRIWLG
jgi:hypothetical protein